MDSVPNKSITIKRNPYYKRQAPAQREPDRLHDRPNVLLSGDNLHASINNNVAYFNDPKYNKAMGRRPCCPVPCESRVGSFTFDSTYSVDLAAICLK